jgi:hypothetical protein
LQTQEKWTSLQATNKFEVAKAQSSLLALPSSLHRVRPAKIEQAMSSVFPTLATVRKYHDEAVALGSICEIIAEASALLSVGKSIQSHQITFLAREILREYYYLTIAEIRFCMEQGVRGEYGQIYDRLDASVVSEWFGKYTANRTLVGEEINSRRMGEENARWRKEASENQNLKPMPESVKESIENLSNGFLVDGEIKKGIKSGEFEPDAFVIQMIKSEWESSEKKYTFEQFKSMRVAQIKAQMKK